RVSAWTHANARGALTIDGSLRGTLDAPELHFAIRGQQVVLSGVQLGDIDAGLDYAKARTQLHAKLEQLELTADARQDFGLGAIRQGLDVGATPFTAQLTAEHFQLGALTGL